MYELVLRGGTLGLSVQPRVAIGIRDGRIADIGPDAAVESQVTIELDGRVVLPGFVETHTHLDKAMSGHEWPNRSGTLEEAVGLSKEFSVRTTQQSMVDRAVSAALFASALGTTTLRTHVNVSWATGLKPLDALLEARKRVADTIDIQIVVLPDEYLAGDEGRRGRELLAAALEEGADAAGGSTLRDRDQSRAVDEVFKVACRLGKPIDLHVDESLSPTNLALAHIAERTLAEGYQGRVIASHCCSLGIVDAVTAARVIDRVALADLTVVTLPATNLFLQGRNEPQPRRGITRVKELIAAGVNVVCGSDNLNDMFNPMGRPDPLLMAFLLAHVAQMGSEPEQRYLIESITTRAAVALGFESRLQIGDPADLVVLDTGSAGDVLWALPRRYLVVKRGRVVAGTAERHLRTDQRLGAPPTF